MNGIHSRFSKLISWIFEIGAYGKKSKAGYTRPASYSVGLQAVSLVAIGALEPILLATAVVPFGIVSGFFPYKTTLLDERLSPDLNDSLSKPVFFVYKQSAYLGSKKAQWSKDNRRLPNLFRSSFFMVEFRYKQHRDSIMTRNTRNYIEVYDCPILIGCCVKNEY